MCFGLDEPQPPFTRYNRLSNRLYNQFDNRLYRVNKHPTGCQTSCQTGLTTGLTTVLNEQLFVQPVVNLGCTTGLTTGLTTGCIVYTNIYRFDNRLYRVHGALLMFDLELYGIPQVIERCVPLVLAFY